MPQHPISGPDLATLRWMEDMAEQAGPPDSRAFVHGLRLAAEGGVVQGWPPDVSPSERALLVELAEHVAECEVATTPALCRNEPSEWGIPKAGNPYRAADPLADQTAVAGEEWSDPQLPQQWIVTLREAFGHLHSLPPNDGTHLHFRVRADGALLSHVEPSGEAGAPQGVEIPPGWRWHEVKQSDGTWKRTSYLTPDLPQLAMPDRAWEYHRAAIAASLPDEDEESQGAEPGDRSEHAGYWVDQEENDHGATVCDWGVVIDGRRVYVQTDAGEEEARRAIVSHRDAVLASARGEQGETPDDRERAIVRRLVTAWGDIEVIPDEETVDGLVSVIGDTGKVLAMYAREAVERAQGPAPQGGPELDPEEQAAIERIKGGARFSDLMTLELAALRRVLLRAASPPHGEPTTMICPSGHPCTYGCRAVCEHEGGSPTATPAEPPPEHDRRSWEAGFSEGLRRAPNYNASLAQAQAEPPDDDNDALRDKVRADVAENDLRLARVRIADLERMLSAARAGTGFGPDPAEPPPERMSFEATKETVLQGALSKARADAAKGWAAAEEAQLDIRDALRRAGYSVPDDPTARTLADIITERTAEPPPVGWKRSPDDEDDEHVVEAHFAEGMAVRLLLDFDGVTGAERRHWEAVAGNGDGVEVTAVGMPSRDAAKRTAEVLHRAIREAARTQGSDHG